MTKLLDMKIYETVKEILKSSQNRSYITVNNIMVDAYWNIGKIIIEAQNRFNSCCRDAHKEMLN